MRNLKSPLSLKGRTSRLAAATAALLCCLGAAYLSGRTGLSKLRSDDSLQSGSLAAADSAVALTPSDPDAHYARALALSFNGAAAGDVVKEYERAAALRPRDYFLWLAVGSARDQAGDERGAVAAYREVVSLAPFYAQPRWQLGNVLLRIGRSEEAVAELRLAAASDPKLLPAFIDLAWGASGGDAGAVEQLVNPNTDAWRLALSRFFVKRGKTAEALSLFRLAGGASDKERSELLRELLTAKRFTEAYEVWASGMNGEGARRQPITGIIDPGFEERIKLDETGFGWQIPRDLQSVRVSIDQSQAREGASSLRLDWGGDSNPASTVVSQIVLVEPSARYRLRFAARTDQLVTGGPPLIAITDPGGDESHELARSDLLPPGTTSWRDYTVEFATGKETRAVRIVLRRQSCSSAPCPIFGSLWLDNFSLERL
jgi:tetratricopeptide (TPR) repeat protein